MSNLNVTRVLNELNEREFSYEKIVYDPIRKVLQVIETTVPTRKTTRKISDRKPKSYKQKVHEKIDRKVSAKLKQEIGLTA